MMRPCAAGAVVGAIALTTTACVEYREEWHFDAHGAGRVIITCQPSAHWRATRSRAQWEHVTRLFVPPYAALSQACAHAGVRLERCRWQYDARQQMPSMQLIIAFEELPHVARCALFAGRELQWRRSERTVTLFHAVRAYDAVFRILESGPLPPEWFADGRITITTHMPGRITQAEGGKAVRRVVTATVMLNELASGRPLELLAEARLPWRWWWLVSTLIAAALALAAGVWLVWQHRRRLAQMTS